MVMCKIFGHKMQPRYHSKPVPGSSYRGHWTAEDIEATKTKIYVHDICARCGLIIKGESK